MGKWETVADGEDIDINKYQDYREYDTIAERDAASVGWGSGELGRDCTVVETGYKYYWNGAAWSQYPSFGGAGAPTSASYVTINAEAGLSAETQHANITGAGLHVTKAHKAEHENAGADEISVTGLSGVLADDQDADHIVGVTVDDAAKADGRVLVYKAASGNLEYDTGPAPAGHHTTHENGNADEINVAGLSGELADNQPPKDHKANHITGGGDAFIAGDNLDCVARTRVEQAGVLKSAGRRTLNFIPGSGIGLTMTDDVANEEVDIDIHTTSGSSYKLEPDYTVYKVGATWYAMDEDGNVDYDGAAPATVINSALGAAGGGSYLKRVVIKGDV